MSGSKWYVFFGVIAIWMVKGLFFIHSCDITLLPVHDRVMIVQLMHCQDLQLVNAEAKGVGGSDEACCSIIMSSGPQTFS